jgi:hypothetical protein
MAEAPRGALEDHDFVAGRGEMSAPWGGFARFLARHWARRTEIGFFPGYRGTPVSRGSRGHPADYRFAGHRLYDVPLTCGNAVRRSHSTRRPRLVTPLATDEWCTLLVELCELVHVRLASAGLHSRKDMPRGDKCESKENDQSQRRQGNKEAALRALRRSGSAASDPSISIIEATGSRNDLCGSASSN